MTRTITDYRPLIYSQLVIGQEQRNARAEKLQRLCEKMEGLILILIVGIIFFLEIVALYHFGRHLHLWHVSTSRQLRHDPPLASAENAVPTVGLPVWEIVLLPVVEREHPDVLLVVSGTNHLELRPVGNLAGCLCRGLHTPAHPRARRDLQ